VKRHALVWGWSLLILAGGLGVGWGQGKVTGLTGRVEHRVAGGGWVRTRLGLTLEAGSEIRTAGRSVAELTFPDGTTYRLGPRSELRIQTLAPSEVALARGGLFARIARGSAVRLRGRYGTVAVRGTKVDYEIVDDREYVQVWDGEAQYETATATIPLAAGTGIWLTAEGVMPPAPLAVPPPSFSGGETTHFWDQVSSGVETVSLPGTALVEQSQSRQAAQQEDTVETEPARRVPTRGDIGVVIEQVGGQGTSGARAAGASDAWGLGALPLALAAQPAGRATLGRTFGKKLFGPYLYVQSYGLWAENGSFWGARGRASAVVKRTYVQVSGRVDTFTHQDADWLLDESFAQWRGESWELTAGRLRILEGPVNNSDLGTLTSFGLHDGLYYHACPRAGTEVSLAWLEDSDSLLGEDRSGWYGRVAHKLGPGSVALAARRENGRATGVVGQFTWPLSRDRLDAYAELGDDPAGHHLETVGLYSPGLYYAHNLDLFVERARRDGFDTLTSLSAYWEFAEGQRLVAIAQHSRRLDDWRLGVGFIASLRGW
jgi:hypothetical protein